MLPVRLFAIIRPSQILSVCLLSAARDIPIGAKLRIRRRRRSSRDSDCGRPNCLSSVFSRSCPGCRAEAPRAVLLSPCRRLCRRCRDKLHPNECAPPWLKNRKIFRPRSSQKSPPRSFIICYVEADASSRVRLFGACGRQWWNPMGLTMCRREPVAAQCARCCRCSAVFRVQRALCSAAFLSSCFVRFDKTNFCLESARSCSKI